MEGRTKDVPRPPLFLADDITARHREEMLLRWNERVAVTAELKKTPKPPLLINKSVFLDESYKSFVKHRRVEKLEYDMKEKLVAVESGRFTTDDLAGGDGGDLRGEDLRNFQRMWLIMVKLVAFLKLRSLAMQFKAMLTLRRVLAPKIRAMYVKRRRAQREQTAVQMFKGTMTPVTVEFLKSIPFFALLEDAILADLVDHFTPACRINEFVIDERAMDDVFILDQGSVAVTKRHTPTTDVIATLFATKKYAVMNGLERFDGPRPPSIEKSLKSVEMHRVSRTMSIVSVAKEKWKEELDDDVNNPFLAGGDDQTRDSGKNRSRHVRVVDDGKIKSEDTSFEASPSSIPRQREHSVVDLVDEELDNDFAATSSPFKVRRTFTDIIRDSYTVVGKKSKGSVLGLLSVLENEKSFVGFRAGRKRCMLWRLPRRVLTDALHKHDSMNYSANTNGMTSDAKILALSRALRLEQLRSAFPPTPPALKNCDINVVFRQWSDSALADLCRVLEPQCFFPGETVYDSTSQSIVFIARGVATLTTTMSVCVAATQLYAPSTTKPKNAAASRNSRKNKSTASHVAVSSPGATMSSLSGEMAMSGSLVGHPSGVAPTLRTVDLSELVSLTHEEVIGPWQSAGEIASLVTERRSAVAVANSRVDLWTCPKDKFLSIAQNHPALLSAAYMSIRELRCEEIRKRGTGVLKLFLQGDPLFKGFSDRVLEEMCNFATPFWIPPHETVCGKDPTILMSLQVILDGSAFIQKTGATGLGGGGDGLPDSVVSLLSSQLTSGTVLNSAAMVLEQTWVHSYQVRTRTVVEGFEITTDAFIRALEKAYGKSKDNGKVIMGKLHDAAVAISGNPQYVPFVVVKPTLQVAVSA